MATTGNTSTRRSQIDWWGAAGSARRERGYTGTPLSAVAEGAEVSQETIRAGEIGRLTLEAAAERYCALSSPEMHHLLTVELGWSREAYEDWLTALAETELLGPG